MSQDQGSDHEVGRQMFGTALDLAIGLMLTFFLVSVLCSAMVEAVANVLKKRAKYLLRGLRDMLDTPTEVEPAGRPGVDLGKVRDARAAEQTLYDEALRASTPAGEMSAGLDAAAGVAGGSGAAGSGAPAGTRDAPLTVRLMGHPLLSSLKQSRAGGKVTRNPAYVPARTFVMALLDLVVPGEDGRTTLVEIRERVAALDDRLPLKGALVALLKDAGDDIERFRENLERWYDAQMDRISGAYKRWAKRWLIIVGLAVAILLNVDTIAVGRALYGDEPLRQAAVAAATNGTLCPQGAGLPETRTCVSEALADLGSAGLPVGWPMDDPPDTAAEWLVKALGLLLTAGAVSFGAPFWFDLLNRFGSLRSSGGKPASSGG